MPETDPDIAPDDAVDAEVTADTDSDAQAPVLALTDIAAELGVGYPALRRFADAPGVKEAVGAGDVKGAKGVRYPRSAVQVFREMMQAADDKAITPKTAAAWIARRDATGKPVVLIDAPRETAIARKPQFDNSPTIAPTDLLRLLQQGQGTAEAIVEIVATGRELAQAYRSAAPLDALHSLADAARVTGLSQRTIRANCPSVREGSRRKYATSDLRQLLDALKREPPPGERRRLPRALEAPKAAESEPNSETKSETV